MWWKVTASKKRWSLLPGKEMRKSPNRSESEHFTSGDCEGETPSSRRAEVENRYV